MVVQMNTLGGPRHFLTQGQNWPLMLLNWEDVFVQYISFKLAIVRQSD